MSRDVRLETHASSNFDTGFINGLDTLDEQEESTV